MNLVYSSPIPSEFNHFGVIPVELLDSRWNPWGIVKYWKYIKFAIKTSKHNVWNTIKKNLTYLFNQVAKNKYALGLFSCFFWSSTPIKRPFNPGFCKWFQSLSNFKSVVIMVLLLEIHHFRCKKTHHMWNAISNIKTAVIAGVQAGGQPHYIHLLTHSGHFFAKRNLCFLNSSFFLNFTHTFH